MIATRWRPALRLQPMLGALALVVGAVPLFVNAIAPLQDWPSHLARIAMMHAMGQGPTPWAEWYEAHSLFQPNGAMDAITLALMQLGFGVQGAGRLCLLLCYALFVGGMLRLAMAMRTVSALTVPLAVLAFYNAGFFFGLVNYQFGLALCFWGVALWLRHGTAVRLALAGPGALAVVLCHPVAGLLYAGILGCLDLYAIVQAWRLRPRLCLSVVALGVVVALLVLFGTEGSGETGMAWFGNGPAAFMGWKVTNFAKSLLGGGFEGDLAVLAVLLAIGAVLLAGWRVFVPGPMVLVIAALSVLAVAVPQRLGSGSLLDFRVAIVPVLFGMACLGLAPRRPGRLRTSATLLAVVGLLAVAGRSAALCRAWAADEVAYRELGTALDSLPADGVLLSGQGMPFSRISWAQYWAPPVAHIASLGVGHGLFAPNVFAIPGQQPLVLKPEYRTWIGSRMLDTPAHLVQMETEVAPLCARFPAGVNVLVIYPPDEPLPGLRRINQAMGLVSLCPPG